MAADIAAEMGIKVYTIGVGREGKAPYPAQDIFGNMTTVMADVEIDEELLRDIAAKTGGHYFRAEDNEALKSIYNEINAMEKSDVQVTEYTLYTERFLEWLLLGLLLLAAELFMRYVVLNRIP